MDDLPFPDASFPTKTSKILREYQQKIESREVEGSGIEKWLPFIVAFSTILITTLLAYIWYKYTTQKAESEKVDKIIKENVKAAKLETIFKEKTTDCDEELENILNDDENSKQNIDPFEYVEHLQGEVKKIHQKVATKKIMKEMSAEQVAEEKETQREQLKAIFELMSNEQSCYGVTSFDDMKQQMKLYI